MPVIPHLAHFRDQVGNPLSGASLVLGKREREREREREALPRLPEIVFTPANRRTDGRRDLCWVYSQLLEIVSHYSEEKNLFLTDKTRSGPKRPAAEPLEGVIFSGSMA